MIIMKKDTIFFLIARGGDALRAFLSPDAKTRTRFYDEMRRGQEQRGSVMLKLSREGYLEVRDWMYRNARPIDLALWRYRFEDGCDAEVLSALAAYQNADGGFGHALDCDNWNPNSAPYNASVAAAILTELRLFDSEHEMVAKMLDHLGATPFYAPDVGWHFTVPTNNAFPHAPWWTFSAENNRASGFHATGALAGYILRCGDNKNPAYSRALAASRGIVDQISARQAGDIHEVGAYAAWLPGARAANLDFDLDQIEKIVSDMVNEAIERDPKKWVRYAMRPSQYITGPESLYYPGNEDIVQAELDYLIDTRFPHGVWDISWEWGAYPDEFAIARRWWQGNRAAGTVALLRAFGRMD